MDGTIDFQGRPDSIDAIQWSSDAEVAISFRSYVEILIPRYPLPLSKDTKSEHSRWQVFRIKTNAFSVDELPPARPQPLIDFSIGTEQSLSHVVSLGWSGPGLADNGRCALAVLTSNHILSVWASSGSSSDNDCWRRVLIINSSLSGISPPAVGSAAQEADFKLRARHAKNFAWSSGKILRPTEGDLTSTGDGIGAHYIAVTNDLGIVVVIRVASPWISEDSRWSATVVLQIDCRGSPEDSDHLSVELKNPRPLSHRLLSSLKGIHWSPWIFVSNSSSAQMYCVLALLRNDRLLFKIFSRLERTEGTPLHVSGESFGVQGRYTSGLGWWIKDGQLSFFAIEDSTAMRFHICADALSESCLQVKAIKLQSFEDMWVKSSGVTSNPYQDVIFVTSHSSVHAHSAKLVRKVPILSKQNDSPSWETHIVRAIDDFDTKYGLGGSVLTKTWGLSSSPCGDYIGCIFTLHPSRMLQYEQNSQARSTLQVSYQGPCISDSDDEVERTVELLLSTAIERIASFEGLHFSFVRLFRMLEGRAESIEAVNRLLKRLSADLQLIRRNGVKHSQGSDPDITQDFQHRLYESDSFSTSMIYELRRAAGIPQNDEFENRETVAANVASAVLDLVSDHVHSHPTDVSIITLSRLISQSHVNVASNTSHEHRETSSASYPQSANNTGERCSICEHLIPFESIHSARCNLGHKFDRCSMSFLSIQIPGITRSCRICKAPYLKTQSLLNYEPFETAPEIATQLVQAVQICLYCGGKFEM